MNGPLNIFRHFQHAGKCLQHTLEEWKAQIGLFNGKHTLPVDKTETARLSTVSVAP